MAFYEVRFGYGSGATIEADSYTIDVTGHLHLIKDNAEVAWLRNPDAIWPISVDTAR